MSLVKLKTHVCDTSTQDESRGLLDRQLLGRVLKLCGVPILLKKDIGSRKDVSRHRTEDHCGQLRLPVMSERDGLTNSGHLLGVPD